MFKPSMLNPTVVRINGFNTIEIYIHRVISQDLFLKWLNEFNSGFAKQRGNDSSYKFAQLLRSSVFDADKFALDKNILYGWEVLKTNSADESYFDYLYVLNNDGTVSEM